jgi:hypothetical protein
MLFKQTLGTVQFDQIAASIEELSCFGIALQNHKLCTMLQGHWRLQLLRWALASLLAARTASTDVSAAATAAWTHLNAACSSLEQLLRSSAFKENYNSALATTGGLLIVRKVCT